MSHLLNMPAAEAAWAQCAKTPRDPDKRSPCPPHLLPLPSTLQEITEKTQDITVTDGGGPGVSLFNSGVQVSHMENIQTQYEPLLPSVMRSRSPLRTSVRFPIATLSCIALR